MSRSSIRHAIRYAASIRHAIRHAASIRHASACSKHQTCLGMQQASDMPRHAAQHQTCFGMQLGIGHASACSPASDMPRHAAQHQTCLGMQPSIRHASACSSASDMLRHAAQHQTCFGMQPASDMPFGVQPASDTPLDVQPASDTPLACSPPSQGSPLRERTSNADVLFPRANSGCSPLLAGLRFCRKTSTTWRTRARTRSLSLRASVARSCVPSSALPASSKAW